ncbi:lipase family alpha/beta hydrolase [Caloranaerobacter azorensis]|uniref:lipase family alpha/beta hydrolase n=1 Tax=Caloranaerobacter azorensis TaxID=116090 RepID=UPI00068C1BC3|nr:alpha/beta hydrolase [Caloranaerobacter azorensis]
MFFKYPIVFIPGLFGSIGSDIIPGTGEFRFGPAEYVYRPIIEDLNKLGYRLDENLFIAFYDWRKENIYSAQKYLIPVIKKAKQNTKKEKVNIICHSMGGIVARAYIQSDFYENDVDKLIMISTPNSGAVNAYYFWAGGELPYKEYSDNLFFKILWEGFIWILKIIHGEKDNLSLLHNYFPSVKDLLPSNEYGDYLFIEKNNKFIRFIPVSQINSKNEFLNILNKKIYEMYQKGIKVYLIAGTGKQTRKYLCVEKPSKSKRWFDGKPKYEVYTMNGDGTVTEDSVYTVYGDRYKIKGDHVEILKECRNILSSILNVKVARRFIRIKHRKMVNIYSIIASNIDGISISNNRGCNVMFNNSYIKAGQLYVEKLGQDFYWIIVNNDRLKNLTINIKTRDKQAKVMILKGSENSIVKKVDEVVNKENFILKI